LNRKLLILNLALAAAAIYAGVRVRGEYRAARARVASTLNRSVKPAASPQFTPLPAPGPVLAAGYADIAQKMLFDKSRNSVVELPPPPPPPPPKPVPPMPLYHGQMSLPGESVVVILSAGSNAAHQAYHVGDEVGPFKLVDANRQELAFEWDGQVIRKSVDELLDHGAASSQAAAAPMVERTAAPPPPPAAKTQVGPGADTGNEKGEKYCDPNDSYPEGAVVDGYRKVMAKTPFGISCYWTPVRR